MQYTFLSVSGKHCAKIVWPVYTVSLAIVLVRVLHVHVAQCIDTHVTTG